MMEFPRERLTAEEILAIDPKKFEKVRAFWEDPVPGEKFFIIDDPAHIFTVENENDHDYTGEGSGYHLKYDNGKWIEFSKCAPLLTLTQILDILESEHHILINSYKSGWMIIVNNEHVFFSKKLEIDHWVPRRETRECWK